VPKHIDETYCQFVKFLMMSWWRAVCVCVCVRARGHVRPWGGIVCLKYYWSKSLLNLIKFLVIILRYFLVIPTGYHERRRSIEVMASSQGVACPSTREVQPCPQPACHSWEEGHWSSCELDPGIKKCGEGRRTREVTCRSIYGVSRMTGS